LEIWLAHELWWASLLNDDLEIRLAAALFWGAADFFHVIDKSPMFMNRLQIQETLRAGNTFLKSAIMLADLALTNLVLRWKHRPKLHYLHHQVGEVKFGFNPRFFNCFIDEDFVGKMSSLASKTHKTTTAYRTMLRYMILLFCRTRKRKEVARFNDGCKRVRVV